MLAAFCECGGFDAALESLRGLATAGDDEAVAARTQQHGGCEQEEEEEEEEEEPATSHGSSES